jgi:hypothetical protein
MTSRMDSPKIGWSALVRTAVAVALVPVMTVQQSLAWGHDGHQMINRIAVAMLPPDVPEFLRSRSAQEAMDFYGPQPDHWRTSAEPESSAFGAPDHFIDLEYADLVGELPRKRSDFIKALAAAQAAHPDIKMTPEGVGMQPWSTEIDYERLKSAMRDYRTAVAAKADTKPVEAEIVLLAGILGHFVADGSQPLHVTYKYNGWIGPNPNGYATDRTIHSRFEGDFVHNNIKVADFSGLISPKAVVIDDVFAQYVRYLRVTNGYVEKVYQLDKTGAFTGIGTPEGKAFVEERLAAGATELRDMIYTAWIRSGDPVKVYDGN